jgi:hypothetical protein
LRIPNQLERTLLKFSHILSQRRHYKEAKSVQDELSRPTTSTISAVYRESNKYNKTNNLRAEDRDKKATIVTTCPSESRSPIAKFFVNRFHHA